MMTQPAGHHDLESTAESLLDARPRNNWVRLRTLIVLRWIAIAGQISAITVAQRLFNLDLDIGLCLLVIGVSVVANLFAMFVYPANKRLSEREVTLTLLFDITQLAALLYLTGGLNNPFALLILAPVTISATALNTGPTLIVGAYAIAAATFVLWFHVPLRTDMGFVMRMPRDFLFGFWTAIVIGIIFLGAYARRVASEMNSMSEALLAAQIALSREQKITDLAGVVAAAAHELGTPLATIKLASSELVDDLSGNDELRADAQLIREQADRCSDILHSMGRAGKDDRHLHQAPLIAVVREAAEPHENRGKTIIIQEHPDPETEPKSPIITRRPEIIHGLRNLIQNAVDFSQSTVWIECIWTNSEVVVRIMDDGRGFPHQVIGRIGDPFVRRRRTPAEEEQRPEYQGMGLGLFIAKTLLERTGAVLSFANARDVFSAPPKPGARSGAIVEVTWPRRVIEAAKGVDGGLGENEKFQT